MGTDLNKACITCKKSYYLGYGGEFSRINAEVRFSKLGHKDHEVTETFSTDYLYLGEDGHLWNDNFSYSEYLDTIFIENYRDFEQIEFTNIPDDWVPVIDSNGEIDYIVPGTIEWEENQKKFEKCLKEVFDKYGEVFKRLSDL